MSFTQLTYDKPTGAQGLMLMGVSHFMEKLDYSNMN